MFASIINDCRDPNAMNRQVVRAAGLFQCAVSPVGVSSDLEAAGNLIDTLDASGGAPGVILVNVAPRHGKAKKWPNGTPFGHVQYQDTHIFSTVDGLSLSLLFKLGLATTVEVYDIPTVINQMIAGHELDAQLRTRIVDSQFRSYEFLPRVAKWHLNGKQLPVTSHALSEFLPAPAAIWWVDNFGNCKTTLLPEEIQHSPGTILTTRFGNIPCYARLKDVPDNEPGLIVGSSGIHNRRFVELVVQGKSAAERYQITPGTPLLT